jgi:hypothetical protein
MVTKRRVVHQQLGAVPRRFTVVVANNSVHANATSTLPPEAAAELNGATSISKFTLILAKVGSKMAVVIIGGKVFTQNDLLPVAPGRDVETLLKQT